MSVQAQVVQLHDVDCARGRVRHRLRLPVQAGGAGCALVHNLSETGLLIETSDGLELGEVIDVELPETGLRAAKVVWRSEDLFGCQFEQPVPKAAVSAALLRSPPLAASPVPLPLPQQPPQPWLDQSDADDVAVQRLPLRPRAFVIAGLSLASWGIVAIPIALLAL